MEGSGERLSINLAFIVYIVCLAVERCGHWACTATTEDTKVISLGLGKRLAREVSLLDAHTPKQVAKHSCSTAWVKRVTQAIPQQVEAQHREHDGDAGEEDQVRSVEDAVALFTEHQSPFGSGWLSA